jgi:hypothetical protein
MQDIIREIGDFRVYNLAETFGVLADTIEVIGAVVMLFGGIFITHRIQKWADRSGGEHPAAANTGRGGGSERYEQNTIRN